MSKKTHSSQRDPIDQEIAKEREAQDNRFGEQNLLNGTGGERKENLAESAKITCTEKAKLGTVTWYDILNEEVSEAFAESSPVRLRVELIQVAAVCKQWIQAIDRAVQRAEDEKPVSGAV